MSKRTNRGIANFLKTLSLAVLLAAAPTIGQATDSFFTLTGDEAASYAPPADARLVRSTRVDRLGLTIEKYQQTHEGARVLGGQLTIHRDDGGNEVRVIGAYYPNIAATNSVRITAAGARGLVDRDIGPDGARDVTLMIDPNNGAFFWRVETRRADSRWVHWIGAESGRTLNKFDGITHACANTGSGEGVAYDRDPTTYAHDMKNLECLITPSGSGTRLVTEDGELETHDQGSSRKPFLGPIATHGDNFWDLPGRVSPGTGALVDAHYYMAHAKAYFENMYSFDFPTEYNQPAVVHAHYTKDYVNAFWNGRYFGFGDGDGISYDPLTSMDVAAHEFTHSVTERINGLIYQNESGALNESFSDIMAAVIERLSDQGVLTPEPDGGLAQPDSEWLVGEDFDLVGDGFRNMKDPTANGDPDDYANRYTGTADNGGVHINSGIPNHAFYQLVQLFEQRGVDIQRAADIFFLGFGSLTENADFCDARDATIFFADNDVADVTAAWDHVGVDAVLCDGGSVNNPPAADFNWNCGGLNCSFVDASDGTIVSWFWRFGDGATSTAQDPSHGYGSGGSYTVTLTVTDDVGETSETTDLVTVSSGGPGSGITLTADPIKVKGVRHARLDWSGVTTQNVDIYLDGAFRESVPADSAPYDFTVGGKGGGAFTITVCESASSTCSADVPVVY